MCSVLWECGYLCGDSCMYACGVFVCYINMWGVCFLCVHVCLCVHLQCSFSDVWAPWLPLPFPFTGSVSWEALGRCVWYDCPGVLLIITVGTFSISSHWMLCRHPILHAVSGFEHPVPWRKSQNSALWTNLFIIHTCSCSVRQALGSRWRPDQALALGESLNGSRRAAKEGSAWPTWLPFPPPQLSDEETWK